MYTSGVEGIQSEFQISSEILVLLGLTTNLFGLAIGSVILSSLSEIYGRRPIYLVSVLLFGLLILPVALAKNIETILISRFFGGFFGGPMIASAPGSVTDVTDEKYRALALSCWSLGTMNGPVLGTITSSSYLTSANCQFTGPIIGGFVYQYLGWRWLNWVALVCSGASLILMFAVGETYAPALLRRRTIIERKKTGDSRWWCCFDHHESGLGVLRVNMSRPVEMMVLEPIWYGIPMIVKQDCIFTDSGQHFLELVRRCHLCCTLPMLCRLSNCFPGGSRLVGRVYRAQLLWYWSRYRHCGGFGAFDSEIYRNAPP